jgi:hypothetical protein
MSNPLVLAGLGVTALAMLMSMTRTETKSTRHARRRHDEITSVSASQVTTRDLKDSHFSSMTGPKRRLEGHKPFGDNETDMCGSGEDRATCLANRQNNIDTASTCSMKGGLSALPVNASF